MTNREGALTLAGAPHMSLPEGRGEQVSSRVSRAVRGKERKRVVHRPSRSGLDRGGRVRSRRFSDRSRIVQAGRVRSSVRHAFRKGERTNGLWTGFAWGSRLIQPVGDQVVRLVFSRIAGLVRPSMLP
jgi:hypothetical protein